VIELSGILEIYKYKLSEKDRLVKEKTMALAKAQDDLNFLKGQLSALELDLSELKKNSGNKEFQSPGIENKIRELQSKFEEIQFFLLENLGDSDKMKTHQRLESSNLSK
jgi:hypothetical protein